MPKKQEIQVEIINPEALEQASINKTKVLVDIFWKRLMTSRDELELLTRETKLKG